MQVREQQLQDLLEAKTLAVNRADRVISQYRSRRAEVEAEVRIRTVCWKKSFYNFPKWWMFLGARFVSFSMQVL